MSSTENNADLGAGSKPADTLGSRIAMCLKEKRIRPSELARMSGVGQQTVSYLINSNAKGSAYAIRIATALGVNPAWLQDGVGTPHDPTAMVSGGEGVSVVKARWVPRIKMFKELQDYLAGGTPETEFVVTRALVGPKAFALEVVGRSMEGEFKDGDEVVCDPNIKPEPGEIAVANIEGALWLRKYRELPPGDGGEPRFELIALNPDFPAITSDRGKVNVIGAVVEHRRQLLTRRVD